MVGRMVGSNTGVVESLEQHISALFLVAGGLMVIHTGVHVLIAYTNTTYPLHHELPFGVIGHMIAFVALLGLYPQLVTQTPKLARAAAGLAVFGTAGWFVIGVMALSEDIGVSVPAWLEVFGLLTILAFILGYLAFGFAGLRTDIVTRRTALVVMSPVLVMVYNMSVALTTGGTREGQIIVAGGFALTHLAIGAALQGEEFPTTATEPAASVAT